MTPMSSILFLDFETSSYADLPAIGALAYGKHPTTKVLCACWIEINIKTGEKKRGYWMPERDACSVGLPNATLHEWSALPEPLARLAHVEGAYLIAHNVEFEVGINGLLGIDVPSNRCICTSAMASYFRLPPNLDGCAKKLGLGSKLEEGKHLIDKFSIPDAQTGLMNTCPPWMMDSMLEYCMHDAELCMAVFMRMQQVFPESELEVFQWHLGVNRRGIPIDVELLHKSQTVVARLDSGVRLPASFDKSKLTSVPFIRAWLAERKITANDLRKETVEKLLGGKLTNEVRAVLMSRLAISKASFDKLDSIDAARVNDRILGGHRYYGGHTGRFSSGGVQVQNIAKPRYGLNVRDCITAVLEEDMPLLTKITDGRPADGVVACMRPIIKAPDGEVFIMADYGQIEARGAMWLAGDEKHLAMWRLNTDMYCVMASKLFGRAITKADEKERDVGKRAVLSCCMQIGGPRFEEDCKEKYGLDLSVFGLTGDKVVKAFRDEFPALAAYKTGLWAKLQAAILRVARDHEETTVAGIRMTFTSAGHVQARLRSGRCLFFRDTQIVEGQYGEEVTYANWNTKIRQYTREGLYGGSLTDIFTQATASDLLRHAVLLMDKTPGAPTIVAHVHDSVMGCCTIDRKDEAKRVLSECMTAAPDWAAGFPIKVDIGIADRFMK
jgi:DNA polymerase